MIMITPESSYKGGRSNIAHGIAKFIYEPIRQPEHWEAIEHVL